MIEINKDKINFGNYNIKEKLKESIEFLGDIYYIKTHNALTRLEKNDVLVYESVPGTAVKNFIDSSDYIEFEVSAEGEASIILAVEDGIKFNLYIDNNEYKNYVTLTGGKLNINVISNNNFVKIRVDKNGK